MVRSIIYRLIRDVYFKMMPVCDVSVLLLAFYIPPRRCVIPLKRGYFLHDSGAGLVYTAADPRVVGL